MQKLQIIGGALCIFVSILSYGNIGIGATLFLSFIGGVLVVVGILGDKP
jgi:hypothetical protein